MSNLVSVHLEIVLLSVQDRCTVCTKRTIGSGIILDAPDGTTEAQLKARFGHFRDSGNIDARWVHGLRRTFHRLGKSFRTHSMELLGDVGRAESCFGPFGGRTSIGAR